MYGSQVTTYLGGNRRPLLPPFIIPWWRFSTKQPKHGGRTGSIVEGSIVADTPFSTYEYTSRNCSNVPDCIEASLRPCTFCFFCSFIPFGYSLQHRMWHLSYSATLSSLHFFKSLLRSVSCASFNAPLRLVHRRRRWDEDALSNTLPHGRDVLAVEFCVRIACNRWFSNREQLNFYHPLRATLKVSPEIQFSTAESNPFSARLGEKYFFSTVGGSDN